MSMWPNQQMNFEKERLSQESTQRVKDHIQKQFEQLGRKATPDEIIKIVNDSLAKENPDDGELTYEIEDGPTIRTEGPLR